VALSVQLEAIVAEECQQVNDADWLSGQSFFPIPKWSLDDLSHLQAQVQPLKCPRCSSHAYGLALFALARANKQRLQDRSSQRTERVCQDSHAYAYCRHYALR
jgi:hypothetical protein